MAIDQVIEAVKGPLGALALAILVIFGLCFALRVLWNWGRSIEQRSYERDSKQFANVAAAVESIADAHRDTNDAIRELAQKDTGSAERQRDILGIVQSIKEGQIAIAASLDNATKNRRTD